MSEYITDGQIISIETAYRDVDKNIPSEAIWFITCQLLQDYYLEDVNTIRALTRGHWETLRDKLYPNWRNEDWTVGEESRREIADAYEQYRENVTGQMRLF